MRHTAFKTVLVDTLEIGYEESGSNSGNPIILLHGFPDDARAWDDVVGHLVVDGFRTLVPYLRGFGPSRFHDADTMRSGQQAALAQDLNGLIDVLDLQQPILVGYDWGARAACTTAALWPAKIGGLIPIGGYNIESFTLDREPAPARCEHKAWYQWYFQTERGKVGLQRNRHDICRLLWQLWCPNWMFSDAAFDETARSFDNPDFVDVVIHSYRYRHGAAVGDPNLETIEKHLSTRPMIEVPTIVLHGEGDTIHPPEMSEAQEKFFPAHYERRVIPLAGHLFPREAPEPVVIAARDLKRIRGARSNLRS
ncbi:MAG: alpha/beta hydrolase [Verrucomicrobia bacterium]|jgi:pimeloyl-ACP methyl ester carboxylesterase|nr:alpha/beta hydrolase [Verrucomicrobiota bacterium]